MEDRADAVQRGLCGLLLRLPEPDLLRDARRQYPDQLHLQLADQPMGDSLEIQFGRRWLFPVCGLRSESEVSRPAERAAPGVLRRLDGRFDSGRVCVATQVW